MQITHEEWHISNGIDLLDHGNCAMLIGSAAMMWLKIS
jgi:hypothetical protein